MFETAQFESVFSLLEICEVGAQRAFSRALLSSRYPLGLAVANHLSLIEERDFHLKMLLDEYPFTISPPPTNVEFDDIFQSRDVNLLSNKSTCFWSNCFIKIRCLRAGGINLVLSVLFIALPSSKLQLYNIRYRKCWSYFRHTYC